MARKNLKLIYALKDGEITSIEEVERGMKCRCVCPACGELLMARKGKKMMHHFAHCAGNECEYGYEFSLRLAVKETLLKAGKIVVPPVYIKFPNSYKSNELVCEAKEVPVERVELEHRFGDVVPDIMVYTGGKQFFVGIRIAREMEEQKLGELQKADVSAMEINLSKVMGTISIEELTDILLCNREEKQWKYNALANRYLQRFLHAADKREFTTRGFAMHIDDCPIRVREWRGRPYANFIDDCLDCKYCISHTYEGGILCSGRTRVASIEDLDIK